MLILRAEEIQVNSNIISHLKKNIDFLVKKSRTNTIH
jgi:hypothetical protein